MKYDEDDIEDSPNPSNLGEDPEEEEFEEYCEDEEEDTDGDDDLEHRGSAESKSPILQFFTVLGSPVKGWKKIKNSKESAETYAGGALYPLLALSSAGVFSDMFYEAYSVSQCLRIAIVVFVSFFASTYLIRFLGRLLMPKRYKDALDTEFGKKYVMTLVGSLAFFYFLYTVGRPLGEVLIFLPIYTLYILVAGVKFLRVKTENGSWITGALCLVVLGCPIAIAYLFMLTGILGNQ